MFYTLSTLANMYLKEWYKSNIISLIYPNQNLSSQKVSEFLKVIGNNFYIQKYLLAYINFLQNYLNIDLSEVLIDSTGIPTAVSSYLKALNVHNGQVNDEIRLIIVTHKSSGLPLFFYPIEENSNDISTFLMCLEHLKALGIDPEEVIVDAGYYGNANIDALYDENHKAKISFISRVRSNHKIFKEAVNKFSDCICDEKNLIIHNYRELYCIKTKVFIGTNNNNPAYLYLFKDINRDNDEKNRGIKKAKDSNKSKGEIYNAIIKGNNVFFYY